MFQMKNTPPQNQYFPANDERMVCICICILPKFGIFYICDYCDVLIEWVRREATSQFVVYSGVFVFICICISIYAM